MTIPSYVLTDKMGEFIDKLQEALTKKLDDNTYDIRRAYKKTNNGFIDTKKSLGYTRAYLKDKLDNDDKIKEIDSDLEDIMDKLDDLNSESDA